MHGLSAFVVDKWYFVAAGKWGHRLLIQRLMGLGMGQVCRTIVRFYLGRIVIVFFDENRRIQVPIRIAFGQIGAAIVVIDDRITFAHIIVHLELLVRPQHVVLQRRRATATAHEIAARILAQIRIAAGKWTIVPIPRIDRWILVFHMQYVLVRERRMSALGQVLRGKQALGRAVLAEIRCRLEWHTIAFVIVSIQALVRIEIVDATRRIRSVLFFRFNIVRQHLINFG